MSQSAPSISHLMPPVTSPGASIAGKLEQVILIGLSPSIANHVLAPIGAVATAAEIQMKRPADLGASPAFPDGTLLVVQDRSTGHDGVELLRGLRRGGGMTPAILIVTTDDFDCPSDLDQLGDLDVIPLSEFSRFAFRRSLVLLGSQRARESLLEEVGDRLRAYERLLAAKDEERQRVLDVATALELRLSNTEKGFQLSETEWAQKLAHAEADVARLEQRIAELETGNGETSDEAMQVKATEDARQRRQHALELAFHQDQRIQQDQALAELRQTCATQDQEILRLQAQQIEVGELTTRLQASERVRISQTQLILVHQQRIREVEQHLATIALLLEAEQSTEPTELLEELAGRLAQVETVRSEQQDIIDRLSLSLAEQQIDSTLDGTKSRRDAMARIDGAVQRSQRLGIPLICLMIGIDDPQRLRSELGSLSYDFMQVQIAQRLQRTLRHGDVVMRYSDGELVLISGAKTTVEARSHAERLIRKVCAQPLELEGRRQEVRVSISVLAYDDAMGGAHELIRRAKGTLLEAQARGARQILVGTSATGPAPGRETRSARRGAAASFS